MNRPEPSEDPEFRNDQTFVLVVLATVQLLSMSLWFSASAVVPELERAWNLQPGTAAWLTMSVQFGFVTGSVISAVFTLSDVWSPRFLLAGSALLGAAVTAAIPAFSAGPASAIVLRFVTGVSLAGVYPPGMKIMAGWFRERRGLAIGVLVGALTVGSAMPHLLRVFGGVGNWRMVLYLAALLAVVSSLIAVKWLRPGPYQAPRAPFDPAAVGRILQDRGVMLANMGYFGHMWELYAVWTWIPVFLTESFSRLPSNGATQTSAALLSFATIAIGGAGAWLAGVWSDRFGRTLVTSASMLVSGGCCLTAGLVFGTSPLLLGPFCLIWGFAIVADSAQFSTCVTELAEGRYVGTALTLQTAIGFLLTTVSIRLVPQWQTQFGWQGAFAWLSLGPLVGTVSMLILRYLPEASQLAGGRR